MSGGKYAGPWLVPIPRLGELYLKAQTTTIAPTSILAGAPKGLYRVSMVHAVTATGTSGQLQATIQSVPDNGQTTIQYMTPINIAAFDVAQDSFICEVGGVSNIQYTVVAIGTLTPGALQYTLRVVVEQLSALT